MPLFFQISLSGGPSRKFSSHQHLHLSQLGVVAWRGTADDRVFVPVVFATSATVKDVSTKSLLLGITSSVPLDVLVWRLAPKKESRCEKYSSWQRVKHTGAILPHKQLLIELPHSLAGEVCLEAQGQEHESDTWYPISAVIDIPR